MVNDSLGYDYQYGKHRTSEGRSFDDNSGNEVKSNLPLQVAFYFNIWLLPVWFIVLLYNLDVKYFELSDIYKYITVAILTTIFLLECVRLYLGYFGNLAEKIPELASFWLISTLLQLPLELLLSLDHNTLPYLSDRIMNGLALFFLVFEIIFGTITLKTLADHHAKRYIISQLYGIGE